MRDWKITTYVVVLTIAGVGQIISAIILYNPEGNVDIINTGWVILWISAVFGWLPIFTFKRKGGVADGQSYIQTTQLVETGVYAIVRHPQYLAGVLMSIALPLITQHWVLILLGVVFGGLSIYSTYDEDHSNIEKFGDAYRAYMQKVPRLNFLLGILRWLIRKTGR